MAVNYPFGDCDYKNPAHAAAQAVTITEQMTILEPAIATANVTLNLTIDAQVKRGAMLIVKFKTTATETLTFGTGCDSAVITGVAGKTQVQALVFDGTLFVGITAKVQID
jgi:hypothetical protein